MIIRPEMIQNNSADGIESDTITEPDSLQKMKNDTVLLLSQLEDRSGHQLAKYIDGNMSINSNISLHYIGPLQQIFQKVIAYDFIERMAEIGVTGINREIVELVKKEKPEYMLWLASMYEIFPATLDTIRQEGCRVIGWFGDDEVRFAYYSRWWIPHLDYVVTIDIQAIPKYQALNTRVIHELSCEGVPVERDWSKIEEKYEVSFVGWRVKAERERYINEIRKRNIPLSLFGKGWEGGYVSYEKMLDIFKTSKINLNFSGTGIRKGLKARIPLVCLAGGFLLTEYVPGLENYFKLDKEIVCFKNAEEMIEKITYYLHHDEERRAIARAGWERATNEYTPFHMLSRVFEKIENDLAAGDRKSQPPALKMPLWIRHAPSRYYFQWGRAFLEEGYNSLWKDALSLSLAYNPFNIAARYYYIAGISPSLIRLFLFKLYRPYNALEKLISGFCFRLFDWADTVPFLRNIKRSVSKMISYS
jgi:spore maturation protein CgeB